jgi:hypothetical protein
MKYYFLKLIPPRADFMRTMTAEERSLMQEHLVYCKGFADKGWAVAYGPVATPEGGYGAGFWELPDEIDPKSITENDPTMKAGVGFGYEVYPMPALAKGRIPS